MAGAGITAQGAQAAAGAKAPTRRKKSWREVMHALSRPKVALMLLLGISSGLPFMMIGNTLGFWLSESHIKLSAIGYLSWAGLAYLWKFLWGAVVDHAAAPLLHRLGRRRGWMILTQLGVGVGLVGMAAAGPAHLPALGAFAVLCGISAAMQDTVIDAWRIEIADDADEQGLLVAAYSYGFRIALFATEALILLLATWIGWALSYAIYGAAMLVGIVAALLAREPERADAVMESRDQTAPLNTPTGMFDAVFGPFVAFFRTHGLAMATLMLLMITTYHLCDYMRGPMSNPYYVALHISKPTIAVVRSAIGLPMTFVGIALGGVAVLRLGYKSALVLGATLQPIAVAAFALLGHHGGDYALFGPGVPVTAFQTVMGMDSMFMGFSGVALVAYMSSLTSLGYTATQYALFTSAMAWSGKILKGFSGAIVEQLQAGGRSLLEAYAAFYLGSAAIGLPALVLCLILVLQERRAAARA